MTLNAETLPKAWVVFSGKADLPWLNILKPGFRHCFVLLNDGHNWISFDPMANYTELKTYHHLAADFDLPVWLEQRNYLPVPTKIRTPEKPAPIGFFSCVEAIKRVLGIHDRLILTPHQLYQHLTQKQEF